APRPSGSTTSVDRSLDTGSDQADSFQPCDPAHSNSWRPFRTGDSIAEVLMRQRSATYGRICVLLLLHLRPFDHTAAEGWSSLQMLGTRGPASRDPGGSTASDAGIACEACPPYDQRGSRAVS